MPPKTRSRPITYLIIGAAVLASTYIVFIFSKDENSFRERGSAPIYQNVLKSILPTAVDVPLTTFVNPYDAFNAETYQPVHIEQTSNVNNANFADYLSQCFWKRMPFPFGSNEIDLTVNSVRTQYKMFMYHPEKDIYISSSYFKNHGSGGFENQFRSKFASALHPSSGPVPKSPLIVDIGANIGIHTLWFLAYNENYRVHSFEPLGQNFALLHCSVMVNPSFHKRIWLNRLGLSKSFKEGVCMSVSDDNQGGSHVMESSKTGCKDFVPLATLDWYWERQLKKEQIYMMKIDVEGFEPFVFEGAKKMMSEKPPMIIYMEYTPESMKNKGGDGPGMLKFFKDLGYQWRETYNGQYPTFESAMALTGGLYDFVVVHEATEKAFKEGKIQF